MRVVPVAIGITRFGKRPRSRCANWCCTIVTKDNKGNNQFGLGIDAAPSAPTAAQMSDESAVMQSKIAVTAMQVAYDQRPAAQEWLKIRLKSLFNK